MLNSCFWRQLRIVSNVLIILRQNIFLLMKVKSVNTVWDKSCSNREKILWLSPLVWHKNIWRLMNCNPLVAKHSNSERKKWHSMAWEVLFHSKARFRALRSRGLPMALDSSQRLWLIELITYSTTDRTLR